MEAQGSHDLAWGVGTRDRYRPVPSQATHTSAAAAAAAAAEAAAVTLQDGQKSAESALHLCRVAIFLTIWSSVSTVVQKLGVYRSTKARFEPRA